MKKIKLIILIIFMVFINTNVWSKKIAPLIEYKAMDLLGTDKTIARGSDLLTNFNPQTVPNPPDWKKDYCYNSAKGTLVLRFKDQINTCIPNITNYQVTFTLTYLTTSNVIVTFDTVLSINYNNTKGKAFKERAIYVKENVHYLKAVVKTISNPNFNSYVCLEAIIEEDRTFCGFNPITDIPTFTSNYLNTTTSNYLNATDEIELLFPEEISKKCDLIEVEYQFVDAYNSNGLTSFLPVSDIKYDFRHNANRTAITGNSLKISNIFEDGYLIVRARCIVFSSENKAILGNWNIALSYGNLSNITSPLNIIQIGQNGTIPAKEPDLNWQYQAEFAEDAKKKEVMTFFDGLLKNRQTVTRSNTEYIAIVAENIYDHIGRPTISTLPAPSTENKIKYYKNFNTSVSNYEYNPDNFETVVNQADCKRTINDDPMVSNTGAAKYYSPSNSLLVYTTPNLKNQLASYIPNASGYPFTHTEYMPDQTGRIRRQSGAGNDLRLGAGHETKYFYGVPDQMELDRLFGTEVGNSKHYKKNMVVDPNGQASVSYLDSKGRVIATNLAGTKATNLQTLPNNNGNKDLVIADLNSPMDTSMEEGALIINKTFNIAEDNTKYELKYSLSPQSYIPKCKNIGELICYNCIYDLEIKLVNNECNTEVLNIKRKIGGNSTNTADTICDNNDRYFLNNEGYTLTDSFLFVTLPIGNFTLSKKLSVNNAAFEFYLNDYLKNRLCKTKEDFLIESYQRFDTAQCEQTCETCYQKLGTKENYINKRKEAQLAFESEGSTISADDEVQFGIDYEDQKRYCGKLCENPKTGCDAILETLKGDYRPGGQYMEYETLNGVKIVLMPLKTPNYNILSSSCVYNYTNIAFFTSNGIRENGILIKPYSTFTVDEIINNWQDTFTNVLVTLHPEYCKYTSCVEAEINNDFMDDFLKTESYSEAVTKGYLFPVGNTVPTTPPTLVTDPYFQAGKPGSLQVARSNPSKTFLDVFRERLESFLVVNNGITNVNIDIHDVAIINMYCNDKTKGADLLDCIESHRSNVIDCNDNQNYYWTTFKNLYYAERQKVTDDYVKTICPYNLSSYTQRFPNNDLASKLNGNPNIAGGIGLINNQVKDSVNKNCLNTCNGYKDHWRNSLKKCVLNSTEMETVLNDLVNVCVVECDQKNPFGASNISSKKQTNPAKSFYSFEDVLKGNNHLGIISLSPYIKGICDDVLISMPSPLGHDYLSYNDPYADTCACDPKLYNYTGTGISANITPPNPECSSCSTATNAGLNPEVKLAMANMKNIDNKYKCKNCIDCCTYKKAMYLFIVDYDTILTKNNNSATASFNTTLPTNIPTPTSATVGFDRYTILTNYFNNNLGFNLSYDDYIAFGANCFGVAATFDAITQKALELKANNISESIDNNECKPKSLPKGDNSYSVSTHQECYKYYLGEELVDPHSDYYLTHSFIYDRVEYTPDDCYPFSTSSTISNYDRNFGIDTCGCNKILKAEDEYLRGEISNQLFSSAKDYIEKTFNCGITLNDYSSYKYKCNLAKDYFTTPSNDSNDLKTVKYNVDGTLNWNDTRQTISNINHSNTKSAEHILHEVSSQINSGDNLYNINSCGPSSCASFITLCNKPFNEVDFVVEDPCKTRMKSLAKMSAENAYKIYVDSVTATFKTAYYKKCLRPLNIEKFVSRYEQPQYQYTLYYYDQAGNLAKTVPPKGVKPLNNTDVLKVNNIRLTPSENGTELLTPTHQMATLYKYNTLQNLTWQKTPDAGISQFFYDQLGRLVVSQNAKQALNLQYSYTLFDDLGRITEVGQLVKNVGESMTDAIARNPNPNANGIPGLPDWLSTSNRGQITRTYYDEANTNVIDDILFKQNNLRGRVVYTTFSNYYSTVITKYDHAVHYDYDIHGNVKQLMREIKALKAILQDYKITKYDYDLVSGKVNNVYYQLGQADQYMQHYEYDAENRIIGVQSGQTKNQLDEDAAYYYYMHGPLARVELGHLKVQGVDYAYTLQGWLKGVNTTHINSYRDMGRDGYSGTGYNGNSHVPIDEYGFSLNYFEGDYSPIGGNDNITNTNNFIANTIGATTLNAKALDLYNGNIRMMAVAIRQFGYTPIANAYRYDQLNRLVESNTFDNYDSVNNAFLSTGNAMNAYKNTFAYDENGNILTQIRNGNTTIVNMDNLSYEYYMDGTEPTNKLKRVGDAVTATNYTDDIDDQGPNNYSYDEIGNLIKDNAEQIDKIEWTVYGKIQKITRMGNSTKPDLEFEYTPDGHRAVKIVKPDRNDDSKNIYTYYVRDAQGNILATYTRYFNKTIDFATISYDQINQKIIDNAGYNEFANFTKTYSNNADLKTSLFNSVNTDNALLKNFNPNVLLANHTSALTTLLTNISNLDFVKVFAGSNPDFYQLCKCFSYRQLTNPNTLLNLKQGLLQSNNGIQIIMDYVSNNDPVAFKDISNSNNYSGNGETQDRIDFIKNYLFEENIDIEMLQERRGNFAASLAQYYNFDDNCQLLAQALNEGFERDKELVYATLANLDGIRNIFYNESSYFDCDLNRNRTAAISLLSNNPEMVWNALLQSQNEAYWFAWLKDYDPEFIYHLAFNYPNLIGTYQNSHNLYGGGNNTIGKQNYFVNLRSVLNQTIYNNIITEFLQGSNVYTDSMNLSEWHIYGSSRLGIFQTSINMAYINVRIVGSVTTNETTETTATIAMPSYTLFSLERGAKRYELTNHLGNVLVVVSDKKISNCPTQIVNFDFSTAPNLNGAWNIKNSFAGQNAIITRVNQKIKLVDNQTADPYARLNYFMSSDLIKNHIYKLEIDIDKQLGTGNWSLNVDYNANQNAYGGTMLNYNLVDGTNTINFTAPGYVWRFRFIYSSAQEDIEYTFDNFKITDVTTGEVFNYTADVVSANDYSPFGAPLAGRSYTAPNTSYRFSFNGKEVDPEGMGGGGSTYDYGFRIYNAQLGKFLSVDPLTKSFPWYTPYQFAGNTPICAIDIDGLEDRVVTIRPVSLVDGTIIQKTNIYFISDNKKSNTTTDGELNEYSKRIDSRFSALGTEGIEYRIYNEQGTLISSERVCDYKQGSPEAIAMAKTMTYKEDGKTKTGTRDQAMGNETYPGTTLKKISLQTVDIATYPNADGVAQISTSGLAYIVNELNNQPTFKVTLTGYTDKDAMTSYITPSDPDGNKRLSSERAKDMQGTLISSGVASDRITTYGAGSSQANQTIKDPKDRKVTATLPAKAN